MEANTLFYDNFALGFGQGTGGEDASHSGAWNVQQQSGTQDADSISCRPYSQAMLASYPNSLQRHELEEGIKNFVGQEMHLATTELGPLLVSTLGPRVPFIVNTETQYQAVLRCTSPTGCTAAVKSIKGPRKPQGSILKLLSPLQTTASLSARN